MLIKSLLITVCAIALFACKQPQGLNIKGGHSHNDYHHKNPLVDALNSQMVSIEADVFPVNDDLMVAHSFDELEEGKTLEAMYLKPLFERYKKQELDTIILMIDMKTGGERCYQLLKDKLNTYKGMLSSYEVNKINRNHVSIILSGDRPVSLLHEDNRWAALDGRIDSISFKYGFSYYPLISDDWKNHFKWNGEGEMLASEQYKLEQLIQQCHQDNRMLRFWNIPGKTPHSTPFWNLFSDKGVDLIGVDSPAAFKKWQALTLSQKRN